MLYRTKKLNGPGWDEWLAEMKEWKKSHPVWSFLIIWLPFPLGYFFGLIGPKPPRMRRKPN
jgi:hypothetical protein